VSVGDSTAGSDRNGPPSDDDQPDPPADAPRDEEALFDALVAADVLVEDDAGVGVTTEFEDTRDIYRATYGDASDEEFHATLGELFGMEPETAAEQAAELDITREELCTLLSLRSHLDGATATELQQAVGMVHAAGPSSPVPSILHELDDDADAWLAGRDAVVVVMKRGCDPCRALRDDLADIVELAPDGVAFAGIDGPEHHDFLRTHEVDTAPTSLFVRDGEVVGRLAGYYGPDRFAEAFAEHY
jgi:thiol-disulfide isomerase/thioredoxin